MGLTKQQDHGDGHIRDVAEQLPLREEFGKPFPKAHAAELYIATQLTSILCHASLFSSGPQEYDAASGGFLWGGSLRC